MTRVVVLAALLLAATTVHAEERVGPGGLRYDLKRAPAGEPRDLWIGLHGKSGKKEQMAAWVNQLVPALGQAHQVWPQSAGEQWARGDAEHLVELVGRLRRELPVRHVLLFGFSAGGFLASRCLFEHPGSFDGALIAGATLDARPGSDAARLRPAFWSVGDQDPVVQKNGGIDRLRDELLALAYLEERWEIDAVAGLEHTLDGASLVRGFTFLHERLAEDDRARPADRERLEALGELLKAKGDALDADRVRARVLADVDALLATRRLEVRRGVAKALLPLLAAPDGLRLSLGLELAARVGDTSLAEPVARAWSKARKDEALSLALVGALAALEGGAGTEGLVRRLEGWDHEGRVQLAAAGALVDPRAVDALIGALEGAASKRRGDYAAALEAALRRITGQTLAGPAAWRTWRRTNG